MPRETSTERSTSSVTAAPALRNTCASPGSSPSARSGSIRASMHVMTISAREGGRSRPTGGWPSA